jgi:carbon-monoxide dehydrogenase large subunit
MTMTAETAESVGGARYVGARVPRIEDPRLLRGRGKYIDDIALPGMLHAAFLRSPHAHANIKSIDVEAARALDGVKGVFTGWDLEGVVGPYVTTLPREEIKECTRLVLTTDKVRHVGEAVVVVVATSRYIAEDACDLVVVDYEPLEAVVDGEAALEPGAPLIDPNLDDNNVGHIEVRGGDADKAFEEADLVVSKRFYHNRYVGNPLECRGVIADWDAGTSTMTLWTSNQMPHLTRTLLAGPLNLSESKLKVIAPSVGGGFGIKAHVFVEDAIIPAVARLVGRPVKWIEDRYEHLAASAHSKEVVLYIDAAVKSDGTILGLRGRVIGDGGGYSSNPYTPHIDPLFAATAITGIYDLKAVEFEVDAPLTNKCQTGAYRGIGWTCGHTAREALWDDIARRVGMDPVELRVKNSAPSGAAYRNCLGQTYDGGSYIEAIRLAQDMLDYGELRARQAELRKGGRYLGIGFSPYLEPTAAGSAITRAGGTPLTYFDSASVTVEPDGAVVVSTGLHSHGQGHATSLAQVAADALGVKLSDITYVQGDTTSAVYGMGTFASRSAVIGAGSIMLAAAEVKEKLVRMAASAMEADPEDVELREGVASIKGAAAKSMTLAEVAGFAYFGGDARPDDLEPALTSTRSYDPPECYSNGCVAVVAEVDPETGKIDIQRLVAVEDCGVMLNPLIVEGQVAGAVAQGIGGAMYESLEYSEDGQFLSGSLMDYLYPSTTEVPAMDIAHIETPSLFTAGGIKGMGEAGSIAAPAAIVNAVADALSPFGVSVDSLPLGPSQVMALLENHGRDA